VREEYLKVRDKIVSVIIVTCGADNYLKRCLHSVGEQSHKSLEIIVIDNSLNLQFGQEIIEHYSDIKIFVEPNNLFYTGALNKGVGLSKGDFILCLNDDVTLDKKFIEQALRGFFLDSSIGMVSGKILRSDGLTMDSTGLFITPWRTAKERGYGRKDNGQYKQPGYIFGVNGAVGFYRRGMLEDIKIDSDYFDSDFRMFYEDLDIAWRAQNLGWKAYYVPEAVAYHVRGGTVRQGLGIDKPYARRYLSDELNSYLVRNRHFSIIKNESSLSLLLHAPLIIIYDFLTCVYILLFNPALIKRLLGNLRCFKSVFIKRRTIQNIRTSRC
jgi:GT2 family glycosyltransferase